VNKNANIASIKLLRESDLCRVYVFVSPIRRANLTPKSAVLTCTHLFRGVLNFKIYKIRNESSL